MSVGEAMLKGAFAGLIGGIAMAMATKMEQAVLLPEGTESALPPTKLVETEAEAHDIHLSGTQATAAGMGAHLMYSALLGTAFGLLQSRARGPAVLDGLIFSGLVYAAGYSKVGIMPRTGTMPPPEQQSIERATIPLASHTVFGVATSAAFRALS
jgi:uncharacterized membrane protein YagU involved in acid resistance